MSFPRRLHRAAAFAAVAACTGSLHAQFPFPDFTPSGPLVVLDTDSTVVQTSAGPRTVTGGVFRFRNVVIPQGTVVRGVGSNPLILLAQNITVFGELSVSGEDGDMVMTLGSANFPTPGGRGGAAGGDGGNGSPQFGARSYAGLSGGGPGNLSGFGGTGGLIAVPGFPPLVGPTSQFASGGGGGAFATAGDPNYPFRWSSGTGFLQQLGFGGYGGGGSSGSSTRVLPGGAPGGTPFVDGEDENDFIGPGYDVFGQREVPGELTLLIGGAGGGGGGDLASNGAILPVDFTADAKGGGGGGGGGCIVVVASQRLQVLGAGRITANGGHGGGGEQAGSCNRGGGGGGGAGGLMVLVAGLEIVLDAHGETYANRDYDFSLSADGGVCRTGQFLTPVIRGKYDTPTGGPGPLIHDGNQYDVRGLGGFGGMGVVQLMVPAGNNSDGTNTVLDDNVRIMQNGAPMTGQQKQRYLAWRGFKNANGERVDDFGNPTGIGASEGDIRPSPILLPLR